jgi:P4 family phage/plasmid primase-like protien
MNAIRLQPLLCTNPHCECHKAAQRGKGAVHCPLPGHRHGDRHPSLGLQGLNEKGEPFIGRCFAGHDRREVIAKLKELGVIGSNGTGANPRKGLRLEELAEAKGLPLGFLKELGWHDAYWPPGGKGGQPAVCIPYRDERGQVVAKRYRLALTNEEGPRFKWEPGARARPYGLDRLEDAKKKGFILLVEGESDCATLWLCGFPTLGLPGKDSWQPEWARYLEGIEKVYLWKEPDADRLPHKVASDVPRLLVIEAPGYVKDPNSLFRWHGRDRARFHQEMETLMREARPAIELPSPATPPPARVTAHALAVALEKEAHFARDLGDALYVYQDGCYRPDGEKWVRRRVRELLEEWGEAHRFRGELVSNTIQLLLAKAPTLWEKPPLDVLNVQNGLLDVRTGELRPHSPDFLSLIQLPVRYDPAASCPAIEAFCKEVFPEDCFAAGTPWELVAWLMLPHPWPQKAALLLGVGGTGKSSFLALLRAFLGKANVSSLSLHQLEVNRFAVGRLVGKLANICSDLPSQHLASTATFKALTGGDELMAEHKYRDQFRLHPFCRLVFSANHPPRASDASEAFFDRWLVIPFERRFRGTEREVPQHVLLERLTQPGELSGLLNRALEVLPRVQEKGLTVTPSMQAAWREFREATDPIGAWLDEFTYVHSEAVVSKRELLRAYIRYAVSHSLPSPTAQEFGRRVRELRPQVREVQRTVEGKVTWCWQGIGLRAQEEAPDPDQGPRCSECGRPAGYGEEGKDVWWCWRHGPTPTIVEEEEP